MGDAPLAEWLARYRPPNWSLNAVPKRPAPTAQCVIG